MSAQWPKPSVIGSLTRNQDQMDGWKPPARSPKTPDSKRQWTSSPAPPGTVATVRPLGTIRALRKKAMLVAGETPLSPLGLGACVEMGRTAQDMDHKVIDQEVRIHPQSNIPSHRQDSSAFSLPFPISSPLPLTRSLRTSTVQESFSTSLTASLHCIALLLFFVP